MRANGFSTDEIWDIGAITALFALSNRYANFAGIRPNDEFYAMAVDTRCLAPLAMPHTRVRVGVRHAVFSDATYLHRATRNTACLTQSLRCRNRARRGIGCFPVLPISYGQRRSRTTHMSQRKMDSASVFATVAVGAAVLAMILMVAVAFGAFRSDDADASSPEGEQVADDDAVADPNAQATTIVDSAANAMAGVTSVEFRLQRSGAPIFIDQFERIALDSLAASSACRARHRPNSR